MISYAWQCQLNGDLETKIVDSMMDNLNMERVSQAHMNPFEVPCQVCKKIIRVINTSLDQRAEEQLGTISEILCYQCPHVIWFRELQRQFESPKVTLGQSELTIAKLQGKTAARLGRNLDGAYMGLIHDANLEKITNGHLTTGRARELKADCIDFDVVRQWKESCTNEHGNRCTTPAWLEGLEMVQPEWLIDVTEGCLVAANENNGRYVTLSYVWGQSKNLRNSKVLSKYLQNRGSLTTGTFASDIPNTIRHAMWITGHIGERYLWVDSLCIIQDDEASLYQNLNQMHLIYAGAFLCIVAEEGGDADFGLRGIFGLSEPRTTCQSIFELASGARLSSIKEVRYWQRNRYGDRHYHNRAWTLQEIIFSKRQLIFGKGPTKWVCQCAEWHEDLIPLSNFGFGDFDSTHMVLRRASEGIKIRAPSLVNLQELLADFGKRSLTFQEDALPAFLGIQSFLDKVYPGGLLFGHPEFFFDISLLWWNSDGMVRRLPSRVSTSDRWNNPLPSWSWLSWKGQVYFTTDSDFEDSKCKSNQDGYTRPLTQWFTMQYPQSSDRRPIGRQWHTFRRAGDQDASHEGWIQVEYEENTDSGTWHAPSHHYYHISAPSHKFRFPVPIENWNTSPVLHEQTPYLYCKTERIFLLKRSVVGATDPFPRPFFAALESRLENDNGDLTGALYHHDDDIDTKQVTPGYYIEDCQYIEVELVAVFQGWTKRFQVSETMQMDEIPDKDMEGDTVNCYFALWIKWEDGVAYRQGSAVIFRSVWERYKESQPIELILG